jgi:Flp pilus assembly protein TadD
MVANERSGILAKGAILLAVLLTTGVDGLASNPELERLIRQQDGLADSDRKTELLNEAKLSVSRRDSATTRYLLGRAYGLLDELEKAREQFDWALEKDATFAYAYHGLGVYHMLKGNMEAAEQEFRTALKIDPRLTRAHTDLAKLFLMRGDNVGAEQQLRAVLAYAPGDTEVRGLLGHHYLRRKKFGLAVAEFRNLLSRSPGDSAARKGLALALAFGNQVDEAIREFRTVIRNQPRDYDAYLFLEQLLLKKDDREGAIAVLRQLLAQAPAGGELAEKARREIELIEKGPPPQRKAVSLEELVGKLDSTDLEERREAMRLLLDLGVTPPPKRVLQAVRDPDKVTRAMAVKNVGRTGGPRALGLLEVLLLSPVDRDADEEVRGAAVASLGELRTAGAIPVYLAALDDESLYVVRLAVAGLREATGRRFVGEGDEPLSRSDKAEAARRWREWWRSGRAFAAKLDCIEELEKIGNRRLGLYLAELMEDPDTAVVRRSREAFHRLTGYRVGTDADMASASGRSELRRQAVEVLERLKRDGR